jgi:hypothetical protein
LDPYISSDAGLFSFSTFIVMCHLGMLCEELPSYNPIATTSFFYLYSLFIFLACLPFIRLCTLLSDKMDRLSFIQERQRREHYPQSIFMQAIRKNGFQLRAR